MRVRIAEFRLKFFLPDYATTFTKFKQNPCRKNYYRTETAKFVTCHRGYSDSMISNTVLYLRNHDIYETGNGVEKVY